MMPTITIQYFIKDATSVIIQIHFVTFLIYLPLAPSNVESNLEFYRRKLNIINAIDNTPQ